MKQNLTKSKIHEIKITLNNNKKQLKIKLKFNAEDQYLGLTPSMSSIK